MGKIKKIGSLVALSTLLLIFGGQVTKAETPDDSLKGQIEKDKVHSVQVQKIDGFENSKIDRILKSQFKSKSGYITQALTGDVYYESEPNNYIYNANILARGDMVVGTFGQYDLDTYEINITQPSYIVVAGVMNINSLSDIGFILTDPYDNLIYSDKILQNDHQMAKLYNLPTGVYYITALNVGSYVTNDTYGLAWDIIDQQAPPAPAVNSVDDNDTTVTGTAEVGSTITVKTGTIVLGTGVTLDDGTFSVSIVFQKAGKKLTVTATDDAGNVSEVKEITVKDTQRPTINGATNKTININSAFNPKTGVTARDNLDGDLTSAIKVTGTVNTKKKGTYTLTYTVRDKSGNVITVTRKITVIDNVKPVISGATNKTIKLKSSFNPRTGVSAKDNVDGNLTSIIKVTGTVNTKKKGTYTLMYTVTDKSGNKAVVTRKITVK